MHCKIRHFAQAEIQYSTDLFNRIGRQQTFTADCLRPKAELTITALPHVANDRPEEDSAQHLAAGLPNGGRGIWIQSVPETDALMLAGLGLIGLRRAHNLALHTR